MDERKRVLFELIETTKDYRDARQNREIITWHGLSEPAFAALLITTALESEEVPAEELLKQYQENNEAFLGWALAQLEKILSEELTAPNLPTNLEELVEAYKLFKRETETKKNPPKEPKILKEWIAQLKESYQLELAKREVKKPTKIKAETYRVFIPPDRKKTEKEKERAIKVAEARKKLRNWVEKGLVDNLPFLQQNLELKHGVTAAVERILLAYCLPEFSEKEAKQIEEGKEISPQTLRKLEITADLTQKGTLDALSLPIADQIVAEGKEIGATAVKGIIEDLTPNPKFPHTFSPLFPLLTLSKEERFPKEEYVGPKKVASEETKGGLLLLFLPEEVHLALLNIVTYLPSSSLRENLEVALSLIDPETNQPIRERVHQWITTKGINPQSYPTIRALTKEVRSLGLLSSGITPEVLSQTINQQLASGTTEASSVIKILRILYQDLVDFEKEIGFPVKLIRLRALAERKIRPVEEPISVGLQQIYPLKGPLEAYRGWRQKARVWAINKGIYEVRAKEGGNVQVENRLLQPFTLPIRLIHQRLFQPILAKLGQTAFGRMIKLGWQKVKETGLKAFWNISKEGFKKAASGALKKAGSWLAAKLGLTAITTILGTPIAGALTFIGSTALPWLTKKAVQLLTWPFRTLKNFLFSRDKKGKKIIEGFGGFMEWMTSGAWVENWGWLKWVIIGTLVVLLFVGFFIDEIETKADLLTSLVPTETRYVGPPENLPGRIPMQSQDLRDIFDEVAEKYCVPVEMLLAISQIEASGIWSYDKNEVTKFSTPDWWEEAGCDLNSTTKPSGDCARGYCYDTCKVTGLCSGYSVVGPMQFEQGTWNSYLASLRADFEDEGNPHEPHRCNLRDSIFAAAMKIKANSGTDQDNCTDWGEDIVWSTARAYCGSCGVDAECGENPTPGCKEQNKACGQNYCQAVVILYNEYK